MSPESKRAVIAAVRRLVFAGLILLGAWLVLAVTRVAIPADLIELIAAASGLSVETMSELVYESDWSISFWTNEPVAELIGLRLPITAQLLVFGGLLSLAIAALLLFLGVLISRVTNHPSWLAQVRGVLRLVLVSGGVSTPIFMGGTLFFVFSALWWGWTPPKTYEGVSWWPVFSVSLLPAWLLVQAGHGELANWPGKLTSSYGLLARHLSVRLLTRLLKLVGAILVVSMLVEQIFAQPGLGRLFISAVNQRDLPVLFGVTWVFVLIVVLVKMVADLIEIAYNHFGKQAAPSEQVGEQAAPRIRIPRGWLFFSLALVLISIVVAVVGPVFAPYEMNEIHLADRLAPPSAEHILGADNLGRDILSRLLFGFRTTLSASLLSVGVLFAVATGWAALAAYLRRANNWLGDTLEDVVMLPRDVICAFPWLVLLLLWMSIAGPGLLQVALIGSLVLLPRAVGMMREAYGSPPAGRGWLYSVLWSIPVMLLLTVAGGILYTSSLSYFGFGIPPPTPELGGMLSGTGRQYMLTAPWMAQWPSICLVLLSLVWVMAGDALLERLGFRTKALWPKTVE